MTTTPQARPSRRTVAVGAAWSIPAVAVAAASPAYAASGECSFTTSPDSCKCPGQSTPNGKFYYLKLCVGGCDPATSPVVVTEVKVKNGCGTTGPIGSAVSPVTGCTGLITFDATCSSSQLEVSYTVGGVAQTPVGVGAPPDCGAGDLGTCADAAAGRASAPEEVEPSAEPEPAASADAPEPAPSADAPEPAPSADVPEPAPSADAPEPSPSP